MTKLDSVSSQLDLTQHELSLPDLKSLVDFAQRFDLDVAVRPFKWDRIQRLGGMAGDGVTISIGSERRGQHTLSEDNPF